MGGTTSVDTVVVWKGESIEELSKKYPPSQIMGADDLGYHQIEDGWIRWDHRFERKVDGDWQKIEDPRVRLNSSMSSLEAAIDEENRRLFPGDFYDEDDDYEDFDVYDDF